MDGVGTTVEETLERSSGLIRAGRVAEAGALLRVALRRFPRHPELLLRAAVAVSLESASESQEYAQRAVAAAPEDPAILFRCASLMFSHGNFDESRAYARRARDLADEDFPLLIDLIHLAGKLAAQKGNWADAEKALQIAFSEEPGTVGHGRALAELHLARGRPEEAADVVTKALVHAPDDPALLELSSRLAAPRARE